MALSNTATPIYYARFKESVIAGEIPVNEFISMEMNRIDDLIDDPEIYYDDLAINGFIRFCEDELTLTDGTDLNLLETFKLWAEQIFGWWYFEEREVYNPELGEYELKVIKKRLVKKMFLIVARGAAKTMFLYCLQAYFLNIDRRSTDQITTAPTMKQAEEVTSPFQTAITRSRGPLFKFLTHGSLQNTTGKQADRKQLASTKEGIKNYLTNSTLKIKPMRIDKLQGLRPFISTVDEWLSGDVREDPIGAIEQGASKMDDYLIVSVSSEGTVRNGAGDDIKMELLKILRGEYEAKHVSIWYYRLDTVEEVADPRMWIKAQPNIGKTVTYETYQMDVERAENSPAARNDILAKRFGIPMEGYTYFFTYEETVPHRQQYFGELPCAMGGDLSQGDDFCAFDFYFPLGGGRFGVKARSYISEYTLYTLGGSMRAKYDMFIEEGTCVVMPGKILDMDDVYDDLTEFIRRKRYDVMTFGYDPYNAQVFVKRWLREHSERTTHVVRQGARTESVPLGELKKLAETRDLIFDEELMSFSLANAVTAEDNNGNRKLLKMRRDAKIDNVSALICCHVVYKLHADFFE